MKNTLLFFSLFICSVSNAQTFKFGKVSKNELSEKVHPIDSTANAAYLYSFRRTYYDYSNNKGFRIINEFHQRIKIYNKDGFEQATKKMKYYNPDSGDQEKITNIEAVTYNLEGNKVIKDKVSKRDIFDEQITKYYGQKKITFPNLREGSVIELTYKLVSPFITVIDDLNFQKEIPVNKLEYLVEIPEFYNFRQRAKGFYLITPEIEKGRRSILWQQRDERAYEARNSSFSSGSQEYTVNIYKYNAENIPSLNNREVFVNNIANYRGGVSYELNYIKYPNDSPRYFSTTWTDVAKKIYESIGSEIERNGYYNKDLTNLLQGVTSAPEKIAKIFQYVKSKVKWNGYYGFYPSTSLRKAYNEGVGNVGSINLMLTSMLRNAGLDANPVLVSSKDNGIPLFPTRTGFNYLISSVSLDNNIVLLDASEPYSVPNVLPSRALNWQGRLILKDGSSQWINLNATRPAEDDHFLSYKVMEDGSIEGMMRTKFENLSALEFRKKYNGVKETSLITNFEDTNKVEVENFKITNKLLIGKPVVRTVKFTTEDWVEQIGDKYYIKPLLFNALQTNPFKLDERKFPVEFASPWVEKNTVTIQIPEGFKLVAVPQTKALGLPENMGLFKYQVLAQGSKVKVISELRFNKTKIPANYYQILKGFYAEFVAKQTESLVIQEAI